jgi:hypothetical protein
MSDEKISLSAASSILIALSLSSCNAQSSKVNPVTVGPHYFREIGVSSDPVGARLLGQFDFDAATAPNYYFVGFFNERGQLVRIQKFLNQKLESDTTFQYDVHGKFIGRESK